METEFPHLSRAPIREAVLDIKVEARPEFTVEGVAEFVEQVRSDFPDTGPIRTLHAEVDVRGEEADLRSKGPLTVGTICWNESKTRAVQGRIDGFTVNQVQSYESWDVLREQAYRLWGKYVAVALPIKVVRCALRYINRLEVPVLVDLGESFLTRPEVGAELPQLMEEYFMRVVVPFPEGRKVVVTQASELVTEDAASTRGLILDIDAFSTRTFDIGDDAIWKEFDELRAIKNICFFKSLKPATWEAYR